MENPVSDYSREVNETLKSGSKRSRRSALTVILVILAVFLCVVLMIVCFVRAVFFPYYGKKDQALRLMRKEYHQQFSFDHFVQHGDYDFLWWAGSKDFYATSSGLSDVKISVTRTEDERTVLDNYLSYAYEEEVDEYITDLFDDYFPDSEIEVIIDHGRWLHETEDLSAGEYIEDMTGNHVSLGIYYSGECPDKGEITEIVQQIREDGVEWEAWFSIYLDDEQLMAVNYLPDKEQKEVCTYPAYDDVFG